MTQRLIKYSPVELCLGESVMGRGRVGGKAKETQEPLDVPPDSFPADPEVKDTECEENRDLQFEDGVDVL